jgi:hypothetical protein
MSKMVPSRDIPPVGGAVRVLNLSAVPHQAVRADSTCVRTRPRENFSTWVRHHWFARWRFAADPAAYTLRHSTNLQLATSRNEGLCQPEMSILWALWAMRRARILPTAIRTIAVERAWSPSSGYVAFVRTPAWPLFLGWCLRCLLFLNFFDAFRYVRYNNATRSRVDLRQISASRFVLLCWAPFLL